MKSPYSKVILAAVVVTLIVGVYLAFFRGTPIRAILDQPRAYDGKIVLIHGTVGEGFGFLSRGAYQLDDGSGSITVVTDAGIPRKGSRVSVRGMVKQAFSIGDKSLTVILEKRATYPLTMIPDVRIQAAGRGVRLAFQLAEPSEMMVRHGT